MVRLFASGLGAAIAGVIVNAAGLSSERTLRATLAAANWLYGLFILVPLVALPVAWTIVRSERAVVVEQLAE
jgi:hypothetical protein